MSLDVWFKDDIRNTLIAIDLASAASATQAASGPRGNHAVRLYREGFQDAVKAVAMAFGIQISSKLSEPLFTNLRLTEDWIEVEHAQDLDGA